MLFHLGLATVSIIALVWLAIGWREAIVVAIVIPVTILLTLFASWVMGYTLNRVSLFALIFSIGILVDDAIVVIENIARHWGMGGKRNRMQAAIDAVAEVGNPTIVATLTVVAALLPMLFVSGLMGPYMSPIPANASAAMIFSFFVAVIITPWLMVRIAGRADMSAHGHDDEYGGHPGGMLGRMYGVVARPVLASRSGALAFLLITAVLSFGSLAALYTRDVTVKLLPFDNKSELAVMIDLPEGASVEATDRVAQDVARIVLAMPEVISVQTHAGTPAPFNFNGLVRHYFLRAEPQLGEVSILLAPKGDRDRSSHDIALDIRDRLAGLDVPEGTSLKTVEPPPGPPVIATLLAEVYGPTPETRRDAATRIRAAFESIPFVVDVDDSFGTQARRLRATISTDQLEFFGVQEQDVFDTLAILNGGQTVGYSHRGEGRHPIPLQIALPKGAKVMNESFLTTPIPANTIPGARGVVELGDVIEVNEERSSYPIFRHNGRAAEMVTGELAAMSLGAGWLGAGPSGANAGRVALDGGLVGRLMIPAGMTLLVGLMAYGWRAPRRVGMVLAHVGVVVFAVGVIASLGDWREFAVVPVDGQTELRGERVRVGSPRVSDDRLDLQRVEVTVTLGGSTYRSRIDRYPDLDRTRARPSRTLDWRGETEVVAAYIDDDRVGLEVRRHPGLGQVWAGGLLAATGLAVTAATALRRRRTEGDGPNDGEQPGISALTRRARTPLVSGRRGSTAQPSSEL